jgi:hypothetical protein
MILHFQLEVAHIGMQQKNQWNVVMNFVGRMVKTVFLDTLVTTVATAHNLESWMANVAEQEHVLELELNATTIVHVANAA